MILNFLTFKKSLKYFFFSFSSLQAHPKEITIVNNILHIFLGFF